MCPWNVLKRPALSNNALPYTLRIQWLNRTQHLGPVILLDFPRLRKFQLEFNQRPFEQARTMQTMATETPRGPARVFMTCKLLSVSSSAPPDTPTASPSPIDKITCQYVLEVRVCYGNHVQAATRKPMPYGFVHTASFHCQLTASSLTYKHCIWPWP